MKLTVDELHRLSILIEKINISKSNSTNYLTPLPKNFIISFNNCLWACTGLSLERLDPANFNQPAILNYKMGYDNNCKSFIVHNWYNIQSLFEKLKEKYSFNSNDYKSFSIKELPYFLNEFYKIIKDDSIFKQCVTIELEPCLYDATNLSTGMKVPFLTLDKDISYELISIISDDEIDKFTLYR